jgi:aminoglycoside N3'-acetyltransferase
VIDSKIKVVPRRSAAVPLWLDMLLLMAERLSRHVYWSWPALMQWRKRRDRRRRPAAQECLREDLRAYLSTIGVTDGALVLLHARVTGVHIHSRSSSVSDSVWETPKTLLSDLCDLVGPAGTLVMPTNAKYQTEALEDCRSRREIITYDPSRTPCAVGLLNELFWRSNGVKRSAFPYNMLAAYGPLADDLLRDNLNEREPLPHGIDSGYYRICQRNGLVVSIGVPLRDCLTIAHVVQEVRTDWPLRDLFIKRRFRVVEGEIAKEWTIRLPREDYDKFCHCHKKMGRDLVADGVIHEGSVGTLRVDWARAGEVYEFLWRKTAKHPYPYYGLWLVRKPWRRETKKMAPTT